MTAIYRNISLVILLSGYLSIIKTPESKIFVNEPNVKEVKAQSNIELYGEIVSVEKFYKVTKEKGVIKSESSSEETTESQLDLRACGGCIERLQNMATFNQITSGNTVYPILTGKTKVDIAGEPTRINVKGKLTEKGIKNNKFVLLEESTFSSSTNGCDWSISIAPYNPYEVAALTQDYCLTSGMVGNIRSKTNKDKYFATGERKGVRIPQDKDKLESFTEKCGASGIPTFRHSKPVNTPDEIVVPMKINDPKALEKYLLDPQGEYEIKLHGEKHITYGDVQEDYTVDITLRFYPKVELAPLTKDE